jgi:putative flippase GtrA
MTLVSPKIPEAVWRMVPGPLRRRLRTQGGRRLIRFAPAAVLALCATQLTYLICQLAHVSAGIAGATGWLAGAAVSYVVSRWAWERKGRPRLLKETLPFWVIAICVGIVLTATSKFAHAEARSLGLHGLDEVLFAQGLYLLANCVTFVVRFLIFHYFLFADRGPGDAGADEPRDQVQAGTAGSFAMAPSANRPAASEAPSADRAADPRTRR